MYIGYAFVNKTNRKLRFNLLLTFCATFSKIRAPKNFWARYRRYSVDPLLTLLAREPTKLTFQQEKREYLQDLLNYYS